MRIVMISSAAIAALWLAPVQAQDMKTQDMKAHGMTAAPAAMPKGCMAAEGGHAGHAMDHGAGSSDMSAMPDLTDAQKAYIASMEAMNGPMMAAHAITDPDLAFNCGMIAHHAGAIAMSKVVLRYGKDPASKALAKEIIAAQEKEIAEMTAWVDKHAGK